MRRTVLVFIVFILLLVSIAVVAKNMYVPISAAADGANGTLFRSDLRIFNPNDVPLPVTIHFLPQNQDGSNIPGRLVTVPARGMFVQNNIVEFLQFPRPAVGALRLDSDDTGTSGPEFFATTRIYTDSPNPSAPGTFGQFVPAVEASHAKRRVAVIQLSNSLDLGTGFRANAGAMNPGLVASVVTPTLHAPNGTLIKAGAPFTVPPQSVVQQSVVNMFGLDASNGNFTDGFIIYNATEPIIGYGSVVDNRSSDQVFILGSEDVGSGLPAPTPSGTPSPSPSPSPTPNPTPTTVVVNIVGFTFSPSTVTIRRGDTVRWVFGSALHTTTSDLRTGPEVWDSGNRTNSSFSHTFQTAGQFKYYCEIHSVPGGSSMNGTVNVQP